MVVLIAVTVFAVSAGVIATTQVLDASNRGEPVAMPPQSSIQEATPGDPSRTRSRPSVFCNRDERPVDCVRWMQPLDHRVPPSVITTPLGPLLHGRGTLALHDRDSGQILWVQELDEQDGHVVGVTSVDDTPEVILNLGSRLVFLDLRTGDLRGDQDTTGPGGFVNSLWIADTAVLTATVRYAMAGPPTSVIVAAWKPEGPTWEVEMPLDIDDDHGPWVEIVDVTGTGIVIQTMDAIVALDAMTGEERWRRSLQPGWVSTDGEVLLRTVWDDRGQGTSTLHAENLESGEELWARELRVGAHWWQFESGRVAVSDRPDLVVLDTRTGEVQWTLSLATGAEHVWSLPSESGIVVLADAATNQLRGIETATGLELWRVTSPRMLPPDLPWFAAGDDHLAVRQPQQDGFFLLDRQTGQVAIDLRTDGRLAGAHWDMDVRWPVLQSSTGHLYLASLDLPEAGR